MGAAGDIVSGESEQQARDRMDRAVSDHFEEHALPIQGPTLHPLRAPRRVHRGGRRMSEEEEMIWETCWACGGKVRVPMDAEPACYCHTSDEIPEVLE